MMPFTISNRSFNGACVLSAVGSLPMHVMPVLIASAILAGRVSAAEAGLFAAMYSLGQLLITSVLPLLSVKFLRSSWATHVSILLVVVISLSVQLSGKLFYLNWFCIGLCCGALSYLGCTSAAAVTNKSVAYAIRLGVTLLVAGLTMLAFYFIDEVAGFQQLSATLAVVVALLCLLGLYLYEPPCACHEDSIKSTDTIAVAGGNVLWGLFYLFVFCFSQVGFIVFAIDSAIQRGIDISDALWAFAICKMLAAFLLLLLYGKKSPIAGGSQSYFLLIPALMLACLMVSSTHTVLLFFAGILLWEASANLMSSGFQASVVEVNPVAGGMYLTGVLLLGSALGPVTNGLAISFSAQEYFNILVLLSVFLPLLWEFHKGFSLVPFRLRNTSETK